MRQENLVSSRPQCSNYVRTTMAVLGLVAFSVSTYIAWPALAHLGAKLV